MLGRASLYYEELNTVLCECEHVINSRPLTYIFEDVNDLSPLTPAMFLQEIETSDVTDIDCLDHQEINKRIRHVQTIREQLRKIFRIEYLGQLREQTQHHRKLRPLTVGEVVVVENSLKNRTLWSLARVIQLIPGKDGHVRVARVKTETGKLVRPVQRLYNLELQEPEITLPKDLTDSVIRTRRGRKQENSKVGECCESTKERRVVDPKSGERRLVSLLFEWQQGEEKRSERDYSRCVWRKQTSMSARDNI
ncbi:integrase catalytic domain-containing protein [Trichonephila clavipes]|nr:integrase catalytic domain-containing protein [Trichonephila clavipes]